MRPINADTLIAEFTGNFRDEYPIPAIKAIIDNAPTVDLVKHGKWNGGLANWNCSACNYGVNAWNNTPYCPNCGAKMDLE